MCACAAWWLHISAVPAFSFPTISLFRCNHISTAWEFVCIYVWVKYYIYTYLYIQLPKYAADLRPVQATFVRLFCCYFYLNFSLLMLRYANFAHMKTHTCELWVMYVRRKRWNAHEFFPFLSCFFFFFHIARNFAFHFIAISLWMHII